MLVCLHIHWRTNSPTGKDVYPVTDAVATLEECLINVAWPSCEHQHNSTMERPKLWKNGSDMGGKWEGWWVEVNINHILITFQTTLPKGTIEKGKTAKKNCTSRMPLHFSTMEHRLQPTCQPIIAFQPEYESSCQGCYILESIRKRI